MKRFYSFTLTIVLMTLFFTACDNMTGSKDDTVAKHSYLAYHEILTKSATEQLSVGITREDIENFLAYRLNTPKEAIDSITLFDIDKDASIYVVNLKEGGWFIFSGDYSTTPVLARSETGSLDFCGKQNQYEKGWLQAIRSLIVENRNSLAEEVKQNRNVWTMTRLKALNEKRKQGIRSGEEPDTTEVEIDYYLDTVYYNYHSPLTVTYWHQEGPFNDALPKETSTTRCSAGCAVAALAQLLYYTHFAFGFPNDTFEQASCDQFYNTPGTPPYSYTFISPSTTCWNQMETGVFPDDGTQEAALYALVAKITGTKYVWDENEPYAVGETTPDSIPGAMNHFLLFNTTMQSYYEPSVLNELDNNRPIMTSGFSSSNAPFGHTYLIDGCDWFNGCDREVISDTNGNILEVNYSYWSYHQLHVNTGLLSPNESLYFHMWIFPGSFYAYNRKIYIGWQQF